MCFYSLYYILYLLLYHNYNFHLWLLYLYLFDYYHYFDCYFNCYFDYSFDYSLFSSNNNLYISLSLLFESLLTLNSTTLFSSANFAHKSSNSSKLDFSTFMACFCCLSTAVHTLTLSVRFF